MVTKSQAETNSQENNSIFGLGSDGRLWGSLLASASILLFIFSFVVVALFHWFFNGFLGAGHVTDWVNYASFVAPLLQVLAMALTAVIAIWIGKNVQLSIEKNRRKDELSREVNRKETDATRELVRLSEQMFDMQFYIKITAPMWEVAYKWMYWEGHGGDEYRAQVLCGDLSIEKGFFSDPVEAVGPVGNVIRFIPHYLPYDQVGVKHNASQINELSEHMVLMTWKRFWVHLNFLIEEKIINEEAAKRSLCRLVSIMESFC
ncbi:hypothetical protein [Thauera sp. SDU_THAU2]|uniref:hypothetical protein n=1 Tax=Thauera sp. SDU_THAU2 TaxID=3136633 RepID=UPI00311DC081